MRHLSFLVPFRWYYPFGTLRGKVWMVTHSAQWGWEIAQDYRETSFWWSSQSILGLY